MIEITNFRNGSVLSCHDGIETPEYLEITVEGITSPQADVCVNGIAAEKFDRRFTASIRLTEKINTITAVASDTYGEHSQTITAVWDKGSFKRFNFFIDDCIFFLRNIAVNKLPSIFDDHFLNRLRQIHQKYGSCFTLNLFFHDAHHDFSLTEFPDSYKAEFQSCASWLKMSFHAKSEFPDRPYQSADAAVIAADYDAVHNEVRRFAGDESFIAPMVIHWAMTNPENFPVLTSRGTKCLAAPFIDTISHIGEVHKFKVTDIGFHYEQDVAQYIDKAHLWYDKRFDLFLLNSLFICNFTTQDEIKKAFENLAANPRDTVNVLTHEQYCYEDYFNYIPDHLDRIELTCRLAAQAGYKPLFFNNGILGNTAWEK